MKELAMQPNSATNLPGGFILPLLVLTLLAGLPTAVWLDLTNLSDAALHRQAADLNSVITSMRGYYASNVVGRVLASPWINSSGAQLRVHPGRHPDPSDAFA
jgi:adenylate cyclase